jgi:hypothetical protein
MLHRLRKRLAAAWFDLGVRGIDRTSPVRSGSAQGPVVVTQVCHRDVSMYLLALKSFARFVPPRRVVILDDGSLSRADRDRLRRHVHPVDILPVSSVANPTCPHGKTCERLLFIADLAPSECIVQLDSDTLTLAEPREMIQCIADNANFTILGDEGEAVVSGSEIADRMRPKVSGGQTHVQVIAEARMDEVAGIPNLRYVRGCSAFAGFARGSMGRETVERFSKALEVAGGSTNGSSDETQVLHGVLRLSCLLREECLCHTPETREPSTPHLHRVLVETMIKIRLNPSNNCGCIGMYPTNWCIDLFMRPYFGLFIRLGVSRMWIKLRRPWRVYRGR